MKRYALLAATAVVGGAVAFQGSVNLQATTPGSPQTGHLNITGTARAGVMVGYSTTPTGIAFGGDFRSASTSGRGVLGNASATTGATYGGLFQSFSNAGRGVAGIAQNTTGNTYGGFFSSLSVAGYGVYGQATAASGTTYGVYGLSNSAAGTGVYGLASSASGGVGGYFRTNGEAGAGVVGFASSPSGGTGVLGVSAGFDGYGVHGRATHPSGFAVFSEGNLFATGVISGNGSGITNLNATNIATGILSLSGTSGAHIVLGQNTSTASGAAGVSGLASGASGQVYGVLGSTGSTQGFGVFGSAPATTGTNFGGRFESASSSGTGVFGEAKSAAGTNYGVYGKAISPNGFGVYSEGNMHATGVITGNRAVLTGLNSSNVLYVENTSIDWFTSAIKGVSSGATGSKYGVHGQAMNGLGTGVYGEGGTGVRGQGGNVGVDGEGTQRGVNGYATGTAGVGVSGHTTGGGTSFGGDFSTTSTGTNAAGVFGEAYETSGTTYGVWGQSNSTQGVGVGGYALASSGVTYGAYGYTTSGTGWAVYAGGKFGASGTKSFRIDHPLDPENKYLLHYSTESPTPQNFYVGNVVTDANGYAWVDLPDYFDEINKNFKYQLTVVDGPNSGENDFVMVKVRQEIKDGRFQIRTSAPNTKVSWRVDADRNDLYVRNRPPKDVEDKVGHEKGKYQHPEFYGLGPERGMNYKPEASRKAIKPKAR